MKVTVKGKLGDMSIITSIDPNPGEIDDRGNINSGLPMIKFVSFVNYDTSNELINSHYKQIMGDKINVHSTLVYHYEDTDFYSVILEQITSTDTSTQYRIRTDSVIIQSGTIAYASRGKFNSGADYTENNDGDNSGFCYKRGGVWFTMPYSPQFPSDSIIGYMCMLGSYEQPKKDSITVLYPFVDGVARSFLKVAYPGYIFIDGERRDVLTEYGVQNDVTQPKEVPLNTGRWLFISSTDFKKYHVTSTGEDIITNDDITDDPYDNDPDSQGNNDPGGHKGGNGKYDDRDEDVPIPDLPTISATDTGLCTLYNPSNSELKKLSDYLWSDVFSVESFKKLFADPMDIILGMSIVPLKVSDGSRKEIKVGGLSTGVEMNTCKTQYVEVDCGSIDMSNYWDNYLDYDPYTKFTIYLPYVGFKSLHADEVVDKTITVKYHCDILSGACMAYVQCGKKVLYCFEGNISIQIPVTSASYDNMIHGILQMASGVGQIIAGGASMAAGGAGAGLMVSGAVGTATGATSAIKPTIGRSGNAESSTGLMGIQKPYLIISRPRAVVPSGLNKYSGYPAYKGGKLGDFNNFTVVQDIRIKNLNGATVEEMNEAERLCKEGVIV